MERVGGGGGAIKSKKLLLLEIMGQTNLECVFEGDARVWDVARSFAILRLLHVHDDDVVVLFTEIGHCFRRSAYK